MNWSKIVPWILVGVLALLLVLAVREGCGKGKIKDGNISDSALYWKNKYGQAIVSLKGTSEELAQAPKKFRDSIADLLSTKDKLLQEVIYLKTHGQVTLPPDTVRPDPIVIYTDTGHTQIGSVSQQFSNAWYKANAFINLQNPALSSLKLETFDSLIIGWKTVKEGGLFSRKTYLQLDVKNSNPYNQITSLQAYRAPEQKQKSWGIGPFFGFGYGFTGGGSLKPYPVVGIGLQKNFIRF